MDERTVTPRQMTPAEYRSATEERAAQTVRELSELMPRELAREGMTALALNVFGGNEAAIALYRRSGYGVSSMSMSKEVRA
ncbi:N-acetyltransferase [Kitasatospora aureofaciens]|uniref:N-acetyltransferase n=1 Tax=Kitasatospora aureofaciens TaxID=1894 RepID=UPI0005254071|nr:N-acetyltransferase [Kitasatospora aureofaciens]